MSFYTVYLLIPTILFLFRPAKNNPLLVFYWAAICVLSYDNVTDYYFYYDEFESLYSNDVSSIYETKGREFGWVYLFKILTFSKYGVVLMHTIALTLVVIQYYRCSKKIGVLNLSILLYFLCNLVWKHDNIWRQDIAIFFAYFAFFNLLETKRINKGVLVRIACFTVCGFLFHFSAILLIPIYFFLIWLMKIRFQFKYVFPFVFFITLLSSISGISVFLNLLGSVLSVFSSNLSSYYLNYLNNIDNDMTRFSLIWSGISTVPLFYFNYFNKETYEKNDFLRLCINLSWIVVTWRICFTHDILRRPTDYLLWFQVWGYAFFLKDVLWGAKRKFASFVMGGLFLVVIYVQEYHFIGSYYGANTYLSVISKECEQMRLYKRSFVIGDSKNFKRIR